MLKEDKEKLLAIVSRGVNVRNDVQPNEIKWIIKQASSFGKYSFHEDEW